ncbi:MAG: hypothetical protein Q8R72_11160 [Hylemonella sp.]|nr:hypothetical protein [Hylemonella sp.]
MLQKIPAFFDRYFVLRDFDSKKGDATRAPKAKSLMAECLKKFEEKKATGSTPTRFSGDRT